MNNKTTAILLAGGVGSRFDKENLKTLHSFNGESLTEIVVKGIKGLKIFNEIILVFNNERKEEFSKIISKYKILGVPNGDTRFFSALNGINKSSNEKNIFIDVASPFYDSKNFVDMISLLDNYNGVASCIDEKRSDFLNVENGIVKAIYKRGTIYKNRSYQAVNKSAWLSIISRMDEKELASHTEMLKILFNNGEKIAAVETHPDAKKLTTKNDLEHFQKMFKSI